MSLPLPAVALGSHCSILRKNTLYTFSETAFQSIKLTNGSTWQTLPLNIGTSGAQCVLAHQGTADESLYIVGGAVTNATNTPSFSGLQRWIFGTKTWETISLPDPVAYNLVGHGAAFLESTQRIIVFAGSVYPDVGLPSANTFMIQANTPHEIVALPASKALLAPIVVPWNADGAMIVGGAADNTVVNTYTTSAGWKVLDAALDKGLAARGSADASLVDGDDGSRVLMMFDLTTSPATVGVKRVQEATKATKATKARRQPAVSTENQLTSTSWPKYNSTGAPTGVRTGTSLAAEGDMVVISGGDDTSPILLFNTRKNGWVSAESVFLNQDPTPITTSSSSPNPSEITTLTIGSSPTDAKPEAYPSSGLNTVQLLFIILGSLLGATILLGALFYWLRSRRQARDAANGRNLTTPDSTAARMSFQDRGVSFMKEAGLTTPEYPHSNTAANNSWINVQRQADYADLPAMRRVDGQGIIVHPSRAETPVEPTQGQVTRGSGWSRYFSGGSQLAGGNGERGVSVARSSVYTDTSSRRYSNPFTNDAASGVGGGMGVPSIIRDGSIEIRNSTGHIRQQSDVSLFTIGGESYTSEKQGWSGLDSGGRRNDGGYIRSTKVASSVYPDDVSFQEVSVAGAGGGGKKEDLSWLNIAK